MKNILRKLVIVSSLILGVSSCNYSTSSQLAKEVWRTGKPLREKAIDLGIQNPSSLDTFYTWKFGDSIEIDIMAGRKNNEIHRPRAITYEHKQDPYLKIVDYGIDGLDSVDKIMKCRGEKDTLKDLIFLEENHPLILGELPNKDSLKNYSNSEIKKFLKKIKNKK
ncbi:hypothetical protein HOD29_01990 [archaeon]|nr:hypothetical protein [archaeon]